MPKTYAMAHLDGTNAEKFMADYGSKVEATITAFGGKFLVRRGEVSHQEGKPSDIKVIIEFPDRAAATSWYESGQNQAILSGRTDNSTNTYLAIEDGLSD